MKFSVSRDKFLAQLGIAVRGVSTRSAIQTLSGVMLRAATDGLELQATDMELGIRVRLEASAEREGSAVLPGRLLLDVVRSLPSDELSLEYRSSEQDVEVVAGPSRFHLRTLPADDFPRLPDAGDAPVMRLPPARSSRRSAASRAPRPETRRARTSPACSSPPPARSSGWSPPTRIDCP